MYNVYPAEVKADIQYLWEHLKNLQFKLFTYNLLSTVTSDILPLNMFTFLNNFFIIVDNFSVGVVLVNWRNLTGRDKPMHSFKW